MHTDINDISDSDEEMVSARSGVTISAQATEQGDITITEQVSSSVEDPPNIEEEPVRSPSLDLLDHMRRTYRLLDLVSDKATGGSGEHILLIIIV
jgi:hypothetical protein